MVIILSILVSAVCDNAQNILDTSADGQNLDVADIDGDGVSDIVSALMGSSEIKWYQNNGNGGFTSTVIGTGNAPTDVKIIDIDNDGDSDIIAGVNTDDDVLWYENINNVFNERIVDNDIDYPVSIDGGDMNNDGDVDVVAIAFSESLLYVYENDGSETFIHHTYALGSCQNLRVIDFDLDNDLDIIVMCPSSDTIYWYENFGSFTFTRHTIDYTLESPLGIAVSDFDNDGDLDLITSYSDHNPVGFEHNQSLVAYENNGFMAFTRNDLINVSEIAYDVKEGDINNDGRTDFVMSEINSDYISVYINNGNFDFTPINITNGLKVLDVHLSDVTNDGILDLVYISDDINEMGYFNIGQCEGISTLIFADCNYPSLFCDNFNYDIPMFNNDWIIQLGGGSVNNSFTPINNLLALNNSQFIVPFHETQPFETSFRPDSSGAFTRHFISPVFSSEFDIYMNNGSGNYLQYASYEKQYEPVYVIEFLMDEDGNISLYYINETQPSVNKKLLCDDCLYDSIWNLIKINTYFSHRESFPFNSSVPVDIIEIYANGNLIGTIYDNFLSGSRAEYISQYEFIKGVDSEVSIDDYYVMVGTDKTTPTMQQYYTDYWENRTEAVIIIEDGTGDDMAVALHTIWDDMGLKSTTSKIMAGLFLMVVMAVLLFGLSLSAGHPLSPAVLITIELFFMILLTFIGLLPKWLPFVVVIMSAGIGAFIVKKGVHN